MTRSGMLIAGVGLLVAGGFLLAVAGFGPDAARWPLLGAGLALVAAGIAASVLTIVRALHALDGIGARLRGVKGVLSDVAGTVGRQAPVVRRVDDRTRALLAAQSDAAVIAQAGADRRVSLVRDLEDGRRLRESLAADERVLIVVPREVDPVLATRMMTELTSANVDVVPEEFLPATPTEHDEPTPDNPANTVPGDLPASGASDPALQ